MIIDAHAHAAGDYGSAESLVEMTKRRSIDQVLLCPSPVNIKGLHRSWGLPMRSPDQLYYLNPVLRSGRVLARDKKDLNRSVAALESKVPGKIARFLWVDPLDREQLGGLEKDIQEYKVSGIKLHQALDPFKIDSTEFDDLTEVAKTYKLPVFIHLYSRSETRKLVAYIQKRPGVTFIIAHLLGLDIFKEVRRDIPNVYFDTSGGGWIREKDILEAVDLFGPERVVFGSDIPFADAGEQIAKIKRLKVSDGVKEQILGLNIKQVLPSAAGKS